ncbi:RNA polymerase sigma factor [Leucobacter sp. wl10]|uniref:RNA polymerase sigma factor n=1 Tax=Leucobacter sp. wl10 TaxID=2304677 RepID=UPI000E5AAFA7|nr:RNA polymerase sigma factor [Leucobacter sp. wl10]RGE22396.1 RNA polymerase sigma factor [Leucobacter sp. wl10]
MGQAADDFDTLFRRHYRVILRYVYQRVDDRELAEDLSAEVFARAWAKHRDGLRVAMPWLVATARNLIGNEYQRRSTERARILRVLTEELAELGAWDGDYEHVELRLAMTHLNPADALALQLSYWDGLRASEAAVVMECSTPAFWARLSRARRALRKLLAEETEPAALDAAKASED